MTAPDRAAWDDALMAAACIAVDPSGLGGIRVRSAAGPVRDAWTTGWRALLDAARPVRSVPLHIDDGRLLGGLDLAASLRTGRPVEQPGLLTQVDGGFALLSMAERIDPSTAGRIAAVLETGLTGRGGATRFAVIAFDEGDGDEALPVTLGERLALCIDLRGCSVRTVEHVSGPSRAEVAAARASLQRTEISDDLVGALCTAAVSLGIDSMRMPLFAIRVARVIAALDGRVDVDTDDAATAARLVFSTRARQQPTMQPPEEAPSDSRADDPADGEDEATTDDGEQPEREPDDPQDQPDSPESDDDAGDGRTLDEVVLEAALAAMPADLLARLAREASSPRVAAARGGSGALGRGRQRGAPAGVRRARPRPPERLSLIETLRAAAPWQRIRRADASGVAQAARVHVRAEDLHVVRFKQRQSTTTIFVVDASGSSALHRLAEAKGAVELLLADCYVRRDSVAVIAFRGRDAQLLLPPTRSLVRARRSLAGLPGGGGTPLATALDATRALAMAVRRRGETALVVLLTDGRANVARDGSGGRPQAEADALVSARALRADGVDVLMIDTSPRPYAAAELLAKSMGALYRPLPHAGAAEMSEVVSRAVRERSADVSVRRAA
ncbi:MAG: magnesium chelatase subunit D [Burkholderiaceae bacterium]